MSLGTIILLIAAVLVVLGVGQRTLDRLRLTDRQAILIIAAMLIGGLLPNIPLGESFSVNIGGAIIPFCLCIYLLATASHGQERIRALLAAVATGFAVYWMGKLLPNEPEAMWLDTNYLYGLPAGLIAWLLGRSRRGAFVAGILGMMGSDIASALILHFNGVQQTLSLGGAGAVDAIVIAGFVAVMFAELIGEITERITRGTRKRDDQVFDHGEIRRRRTEK